MTPGLQWLWPTPIGLHRHPQADALNPLLVRIFGALRATQLHARGQPPAAFFASDDDLLQRVQLPEWQGFVQFLVASLRDTVSAANRGAWPAGPMQLQVSIDGLWFQTSRSGAFHDVHTHGNCSWSGVYVVQVDAEAQRCSHPVYGAANGVTRLYGPPFATLGGPMSTWAMPTCNRRIWTCHRCRASCCCSRPGWRTRPCPTTARRSG
jgi:hypothetical protein